MPTYDYRCKDCEHTWEEFQSIKAKPTKKCPECGKRKAERMIGPGAGIIFKGSGFYETDYRSDAYKKDAAADKKKAEPAKTESKSDSKPKSSSES
ncbi:FmdB family zinc ribbon protein [Thalassoglobus sp.]|uniref:FmdB family zinc ribbon protein n=1 Tax=Thalassoglobus sp. TaxID=2795869 RepID=UPI003AA9512C